MRKVARDDYVAYYQATYSAHHRHAFLLTRDDQKADDLVQEAFVKLYLHWTRLDRRTSPQAWMNRVITRKFIDGVRSAYSRHSTLTDDITDVATDEQLAEMVVDHIQLVELLDRLDPTERSAVVARFLLDHRAAEVGVMIGCDERQTRRIIKRALGKMQRGVVGE